MHTSSAHSADITGTSSLALSDAPTISGALEPPSFVEEAQGDCTDSDTSPPVRMKCPRGHELLLQKSASRRGGAACRHPCCHLCGNLRTEDRKLLHCSQCIFSVCNGCKDQLRDWNTHVELLKERRERGLTSTLSLPTSTLNRNSSMPQTPACLRGKVHLQQASHFAVMCCDQDSVDTLIELRPTLPLKSVLADGSSLLHTAARMSIPDILEDLLATGLDPQLQDVFGMTPFMWACATGAQDIVYIFMREGVSIDKADHDGWKAIHHAAAHGCAKVLRVLLLGGACGLEGTNQGDTPAHLAAKYGHTDALRVLLEEHKELTDCAMLVGSEPHPRGMYTPLHNAAAGAHPEVVEALVAAGASVNVADATGVTPLHEAVLADTARRARTVRVLLAAGADPSQAQAHGVTPLHLAARAGTEDAATALLESSKTDVNALDDNGCSALMYAVLHDRQPVVKALLHHKASVNSVCPCPLNLEVLGISNSSNENSASIFSAGCTPLHMAKSRQTVSMLLRGGNGARGVDVNAVNAEGMTPLMAAASAGHEAVCKVLVKAGATLDVRDVRGATAAHHGAASCSASIVKLLVAAGIDLDALDDGGHTVLDMACKLHSRGLVQHLFKHGATPDRALLRHPATPELLKSVPPATLGALAECPECFAAAQEPWRGCAHECWCGRQLYNAKRVLDAQRKMLLLSLNIVMHDFDGQPCETTVGMMPQDILHRIFSSAGLTLPRPERPQGKMDRLIMSMRRSATRKSSFASLKSLGEL